jgi:hypothetical protein
MKAAWCALAAAMVAGTALDRPAPQPPVTLGGFRVLAGDFHVHPFPLSAGTLAPWDLALEAGRQGLDVIEMTPHNGVAIGRWTPWLGGAMVIPGEEVHGPRFHLIALGTREYISWRATAADAIDETHRQGGVAIAAHPEPKSWSSYTVEIERELDGAEVRQPIVYVSQDDEAALDAFYRRAPVAAIGSSDYHGLGPLGVCRTYVFTREVSPAGVLEAIRAHRTVVVDGGKVWGDAELVRYAGELPPTPPAPARWPAVLGLAALGWLLLGERLHQVV